MLGGAVDGIIKLLRLRQEVQKDNLTMKKTSLEVTELERTQAARKSGIIETVSVEEIQEYDPRANQVKTLVQRARTVDHDAMFSRRTRDSMDFQPSRPSWFGRILMLAFWLGVGYAIYRFFR